MPFAIAPKSTVLFVGDSITDCGRIAPDSPLGDGYVLQVRDLIFAKYPKHRITILNKGIGGDTTEDLTNRWTDDVIFHQPDWLSIKVGINDANRWNRRDADRAISPQEFAHRYDELLNRATTETQAKIVLVTPFFLSRDKATDSWRGEICRLLPSYIKVVRAMAKKYDTRIVETHRRFQKLLKQADVDRLCAEPIHPNRSGHMVIAHAWLEQLGW